MVPRLLLASLLLSLGCGSKRIIVDDGHASVADESTNDSSSEEGTSETGDANSDDCDGKPDDCCWPLEHWPGECRCVEPDEPCFHFENCAPADGVVTCDDLCAQIGTTCVARGCVGNTARFGSGTDPAFDCPSPGVVVDQDCDEPIPVPVPDVLAVCCCTQY